MELLGLHHMSAICGDAQQNLDFYVGLLGLRLVKRTVNFDETSHYHLYYGDGRGTPGTLLTFFPYPNLPHGKMGAGGPTVTSLASRPDSIPFWQERLGERAILTESGTLDFSDPDGIPLRIVPVAKPPLPAAWAGVPVPPEHALGAIDRIQIETAAFNDTCHTLLAHLGFEQTDDDGEVATFILGAGGSCRTLEVKRSGGTRGRYGTGTVHHIAFRVPTDEAHQAAREELASAGYHITPIKDRDYFKSIYFREPGGTLFEIATDGPGFSADEKLENLGEGLKLPPFAEPHRAEIEASLPPLNLPR